MDPANGSNLEATKPMSIGVTSLFAAGLIAVTSYGVLLLDFCTWEFWQRASVIPAMVGVFTFVAILIVSSIFLLVTKKFTAAYRRKLVVVVGAGCLAGFGYRLSQKPWSDFWRVIEPTPTGITHLSVKGFTVFGGQWSYDFLADRASVEKIIEYRQLGPVLSLDDGQFQVSQLMENLQKDNLTPFWIKETLSTPNIEIYIRKIRDSEISRGRTNILVYEPVSAKAWFFYEAGF